MESLDLLEGVSSEVIVTPRLETHVLTSGPEDGIPVLFLHGNASSSRFFEETLAALASLPRYRGLAPDMRGYGDSETRPLDATRGLTDFSDDLQDLAQAFGLEELPPGGMVCGRERGHTVHDGPYFGGGLARAGGSHVPLRLWWDEGHRWHTLLARLRRLGRRNGQPRVREPPRIEGQDGGRSQLAQERHEQLLLQAALQGRRGRRLFSPRSFLRKRATRTTPATWSFRRTGRASPPVRAA